MTSQGEHSGDEPGAVPPEPHSLYDAPTVATDGSTDSGKPAGKLPLKDGAVPFGPGTVVGNYVLESVIGEGGFGTVYEARQEAPVKRQVALKIIKAGMDSGDVIRRFEAERQNLAVMDHPNIARVYDAGEAGNGRPFFVMELIRGIPLTKYCDRKNLGPRQRIDLFRQVCAGVRHAHQKGIVHRDLKPSNVLVVDDSEQPVAKVIDFGIARAVEGHESGSGESQAADPHVLGTPFYMSPEQIDRGGAGVDTRSDIYSLGVLLYELLTGWLPLDPAQFESLTLPEVQRVLVEEAPPKPSARLKTLSGKEAKAAAASRSTVPVRLKRMIRGDLDRIVMRAMEKDPSRRYETAKEMSDDLRCYLNHQPVSAAPPTAAYVVSRFVRRHRVAVVAALLLAAAILAGGGLSAWQAWRVTQMRDALQAALDDSQAAVEKMRSELAQNPGAANPERLSEKIGALESVRSELAALDEKLTEHRERNGLLAKRLEEANERRAVIASAVAESAPGPRVGLSPTKETLFSAEIMDTAIQQLEDNQKSLSEDIGRLVEERELLRKKELGLLSELKEAVTSGNNPARVE